jgi:transcriptional regulator with XRE-family HTH domain
MSELVELYMSESYSQRVAAEVRAHAARRGILQKDLARTLKIDPSQVSGRMRGRIAFTLDDLAILARLFDVEPGELLPKLPRLDSNQQPAGLVCAQVIPLFDDRRRSADRRAATRPLPRPIFAPFAAGRSLWAS